MDLIVTTESAERRFKQILEDFFISIFDKETLASHGLDHHRRVWSYARELLFLLAEHKHITDTFLPSKLIIACYLHDIGMTIDTGIVHGHHSKDLCIRFLNENNLNQSDYSEVLFAIEKHDDKEYLTNTTDNHLLTILSVADDLDAFGILGIYRYCEIYLARGLDPHRIGYLILKNANVRFENFANIFSFSENLVQKHRKRFLILKTFFSEYNKQALTYKFETDNPLGYCGVIDILYASLKNKIMIYDILYSHFTNSDDPIIKRFFNELKSEIAQDL